MQPSLYTVTAEIHHGQYRATLKATGATVALAMEALESGYFPTRGTDPWSRLIHELETTGECALGWVDYTATANPAPVTP